MQTFMYVIGPFLMQAGLGLGATLGALGWIFLRLIPRARLDNAQRALVVKKQLELEKERSSHVFARDAHDFICQLVVAENTNLNEKQLRKAQVLTEADPLNYQRELT